MAIFAYIDAGSGSMLLQVLLAGVLAVPFFFRRAIGGALQRFRGTDRTSVPTGATDPSDSTPEPPDR